MTNLSPKTLANSFKELKEAEELIHLKISFTEKSYQRNLDSRIKDFKERQDCTFLMIGINIIRFCEVWNMKS